MTLKNWAGVSTKASWCVRCVKVCSCLPLAWVHSSLCRQGLGQCGEQGHRELEL